MKIIFTAALLLSAFTIKAQDLTGTWEGELVKEGYYSQGQRNFKMVWELVQVEREVYGIVYFYPLDTKDNDKPNSWYSWYGKQSKDHAFPFTFIQGRYIDGLGTTNVYQFNVDLHQKDSVIELSGWWFNQLESLHTMEKPNGSFKMHRVSGHVSDKLWLKRKEKQIIEKINPTDNPPRRRS